MNKSVEKLERKNIVEQIRTNNNQKMYQELNELLVLVDGKHKPKNRVETLKLAYEFISLNLDEQDIMVPPRVSPPHSPAAPLQMNKPKLSGGENASIENMMSSGLDQPLPFFDDNHDFPFPLLVETPDMQQDSSSLTLSSSDQNEEGLHFCPEEISYQEDSGDGVAQNYVPAVFPDQNEVIMMEDKSSQSSLSSHYASPSTPAYGPLPHLTPLNNSNTILLSPWPFSAQLSFSPLQTTPLHHMNYSPPNTSPILGMVYSPSSMFPPHLF